MPDPGGMLYSSKSLDGGDFAVNEGVVGRSSFIISLLSACTHAEYGLVRLRSHSGIFRNPHSISLSVNNKIIHAAVLKVKAPLVSRGRG